MATTRFVLRGSACLFHSLAFALVASCGSSTQSAENRAGSAGSVAAQSAGASGASQGIAGAAGAAAGSGGAQAGGAQAGGAGAPAGSGGAPAGGGSAQAGSAGTASGIECSSNGDGFPTFDRSCGTTEDCVAVVHQRNCCGTRIITGINSAELARFDESETACRADYPACECAQGPTTTDTGQTAPGSAVPAACSAGICTTYVP